MKIIIAYLFISLLCCGCQHKIKPIEPPKGESREQPASSVTEKENKKKTILPEDLTKTYFRNLNHISLIEISCGFYHEIYWEMPDSLTQLFNGLMFVWSGNIFNDGPVKILSSPPEPDNPNHIGNIYYEKLNQHEAIMKYLNINRKLSTNEKYVWEIVERKVYSLTAKCMTDPVYKRDNPLCSLVNKLEHMSAKERYHYCYIKILSQSISYMSADSLMRTGFLDDSFAKVLSEGKYYVTRNGYDELKKITQKHDILFMMGTFNDGIHVYYTCLDPLEEFGMNCWMFDRSKGESGEIVYDVPCPDMETPRKSILHSSDFEKINIPENLVIDVDAVREI
jgi:hypothetical protein